MISDLKVVDPQNCARHCLCWSQDMCLLMPLQSGSVQLDGIDVRELQQSSLRGAVAVVPQDTVLFADTILRNIRYGRPDATFQEIERAAGRFPIQSWFALLSQTMPLLSC